VTHFSEAINVVLQHEGGFSDDPADSGGTTNHGISLRYLRTVGDLDCDGYRDGDLDRDGDVDSDDIRRMSVRDAVALYKSQWWDRYGYEQIHAQDVATKVFDLAVNMGARQAHIVVQRALRAVGKVVKEDGILGPVTIEAINNYQPRGLLPAIRSEAAGFYRGLNRPQFIAGWLNRAYS
jgi:lysozyme family protein